MPRAKYSKAKKKSTALLLLGTLLSGMAFALPSAEESAKAAENARDEAISAAAGIRAEMAAFPSDDSRFDGDSLELLSDACGFEKVTSTTATEFCASSGSEIKINTDNGIYITLTFKEISLPASAEISNKLVTTTATYRITKTKLLQYPFKRTSVRFGALVVPFKFRLGGSHQLVSSATVAPYVGIALHRGPLGLTWTPVFSAGLGMVPITDTASNSTVTKSAFSLAAGFLLNSSKNEKFTAGLLFGKDYLNEADRKLDPNVEKVWMSLFMGYAF